MRDFRKIATHNLGSGNEELKAAQDLQTATLEKQGTADPIDILTSKVTESSFNETTTGNQKINDRQLPAGFSNSFIGSGNTPQDLRVQTRQRARQLNTNVAGKQSFTVSERHLFNNNPS